MYKVETIIHQRRSLLAAPPEQQQFCRDFRSDIVKLCSGDVIGKDIRLHLSHDEIPKQQAWHRHRL